MDAEIRKFDSREEAIAFAGQLISGALQAALEDKGRASFCVSARSDWARSTRIPGGHSLP